MGGGHLQDIVHNYVNLIYPDELEIKHTTESDKTASYLDSLINIDSNGKTEAPCHSMCGTIKIPPCSKALSAEHRPKLCSPSPVMVTSPYYINNACNRGVDWKMSSREFYS
jgi:hypothetical protein